MENQGIKRVGPLWVLIVIIIVLGIVYLAFRPAQQADAPTVEDVDVATTTEEVTADVVAPASAPAPATSAPAPTVTSPSTDVQVIQGDGFTATIRPVTTEGEQPEIESFSVRQAEGENCIFSWEAEKAASCDVTNVTMKTVVRGVPAKGSLQTDEPGTYQLTCKATGGKTATSDTVACK